MERLRFTHFQNIKEADENFPFGSNAELKKRMATRSGEPLLVRPAEYINVIIGVLESGNVNDLKPLISAGRSRRQSMRPLEDRKSQSTPMLKLMDGVQ